MKKPNILFIFTDQQRFDTLGCYGQELDVSPNLDHIADSGVKFTNAYCCQPVCGPARSCLQTGRYATETGCYRNGIALPTDSKTIAHYLSDAGYFVGYIGKWHLASTILPSKEEIEDEVDYQTKPVPLERRGGYKDFWLVSDVLEYTSHPFKGHLFDANMNKVEFEGYRVDRLTDFALEFFDSYDREQPFFLFLSFLEPHHQNDMKKFVGPEDSKKKFGDFKVPEDLKGLEGDWKENYPDYLGCCHSIDKNVQRLYDKLQEIGILENTIIFFMSDHGCHFKTRNWEYKRSCHDSSIHIPLIINGPGFLGGKSIDNMVSLIDVPPTILSIAGMKVPENMKGQPLQKLVENNAENWPHEVFIQISESQVGRAIRTKKWKYSIKSPIKSGFLFSKSKKYMENCLYDLETDPFERNNLIDDPTYENIRENLRELLKSYMKETGEKIPKITAHKA